MASIRPNLVSLTRPTFCATLNPMDSAWDGRTIPPGARRFSPIPPLAIRWLRAAKASTCPGDNRSARIGKIDFQWLCFLNGTQRRRGGTSQDTRRLIRRGEHGVSRPTVGNHSRSAAFRRRGASRSDRPLPPTPTLGRYPHRTGRPNPNHQRQAGDNQGETSI